MLVLSREWIGMGVAGMIIDGYCGSFPHSLLSTSKIRSRPKSFQMVGPCLKFGSSFNFCHGNHCISCPPPRSMVLNMVLGAAYVSDGAFSSLDAKIVELPVLTRDLPLKVGSFHCLLVQAVWLTRFCRPDWNSSTM